MSSLLYFIEIGASVTVNNTVNAEIARRVFGMVPYHDSPDQLTCPCRSQHSCIHPVDPEPYSTDIAVAWTVFESFPGGRLTHADNGYECMLADRPPIGAYAWAATAPLAICLAALETLGAE
jgi:hypothetical protein